MSEFRRLPLSRTMTFRMTEAERRELDRLARRRGPKGAAVDALREAVDVYRLLVKLLPENADPVESMNRISLGEPLASVTAAPSRRGK